MGPVLRFESAKAGEIMRTDIFFVCEALSIPQNCGSSKTGEKWEMWMLMWRKEVVKIQILDVFLMSSVTRLGDLLDFGQLFKAFGNN